MGLILSKKPFKKWKRHKVNFFRKKNPNSLSFVCFRLHLKFQGCWERTAVVYPPKPYTYIFIQRTEFIFRAWKIQIISLLEENTCFSPLGFLLRAGTDRKDKQREQEWIKQPQNSFPGNNTTTLPLPSFIITKVTPSSCESMIWFSHTDIPVTHQWPDIQ